MKGTKLRRLLLTMMLILIAVAIAPISDASASNTYLAKYGIGTRGPGGDALNITVNEQLIATANHWHIRAAFDLCHGDASIYTSKLQSLFNSGITILPVITWGPTCWDAVHVPANSTETNQYAYHAKRVIEVIQSVYGFASPNVYEIWNEQNCPWGGGLSYTDYFNKIYYPAALAIRLVNNNANLMPGGLAFGTPGSNGCTDASGWVFAWESSGNASSTNAYSLHPYGYTNPTTAASEGPSNQTAERASRELARAMANTGRPVLATEIGRSTQIWSFSAQTGYLDAMDEAAGGVGEARLISNWPGHDASSGDFHYRQGLLNADGSGKPGYNYWKTHNAGTLVGTL